MAEDTLLALQPEQGAGDAGQDDRPTFDLRSLGESLRPAPAKDDTPAPDSEDLGAGEDDPEEDDAESNDGAPVGQAKAAPQHDVHQWAVLLKTAPQRINEVPRGLRAQAVELMLDTERRAAEIASNQVATQTRKEMADEARLREQVAEIDDLRERDPEEFAAWGTQYPERLAGYNQAKARLTPPDPVHVEATQREIIAASRELLADLQRDHPEALARIQAIAAVTPYKATAEGLARLSKDALREIAAGTAPVRQKAAAREAAAGAQADRPKPMATGAGGTSGELSLAEIRAMAPEQLLKVPDWKAKVQRALKAG